MKVDINYISVLELGYGSHLSVIDSTRGDYVLLTTEEILGLKNGDYVLEAYLPISKTFKVVDPLDLGFITQNELGEWVNVAMLSVVDTWHSLSQFYLVYDGVRFNLVSVSIAEAELAENALYSQLSFLRTSFTTHPMPVSATYDVLFAEALPSSLDSLLRQSVIDWVDILPQKLRLANHRGYYVASVQGELVMLGRCKRHSLYKLGLLHDMLVKSKYQLDSVDSAWIDGVVTPTEYAVNDSLETVYGLIRQGSISADNPDLLRLLSAETDVMAQVVYKGQTIQVCYRYVADTINWVLKLLILNSKTKQIIERDITATCLNSVVFMNDYCYMLPIQTLDGGACIVTEQWFINDYKLYDALINCGRRVFRQSVIPIFDNFTTKGMRFGAYTASVVCSD